jgi:hypothetical protein
VHYVNITVHAPQVASPIDIRSSSLPKMPKTGSWRKPNISNLAVVIKYTLNYKVWTHLLLKDRELKIRCQARMPSLKLFFHFTSFFNHFFVSLFYDNSTIIQKFQLEFFFSAVTGANGQGEKRSVLVNLEICHCFENWFVLQSRKEFICVNGFVCNVKCR